MALEVDTKHYTHTNLPDKDNFKTPGMLAQTRGQCSVSVATSGLKNILQQPASFFQKEAKHCHCQLNQLILDEVITYDRSAVSKSKTIPNGRSRIGFKLIVYLTKIVCKSY